MKKIDNKGFLGYFLIAFIFVISICIALIYNISLDKVIKSYQFNVLIIMIVMELFTNLISCTGIMEKISLKLSYLSKGNRKRCLILFGFLMFMISAFLNNITAVLIILPIIFVLLKDIGLDRKYVNIFFACILALSNTGGAASPIGDFPAIVIMNSGITSFSGYLFRAFPFFLVTSLFILLWLQFFVKDDEKDMDKRRLSIDLLQSKYKNIVVNKKILIGLGVIFVLMFICWSVIPPSVMPPEIIALLGCVISMFYCSVFKLKINQTIDFKPVLTIASFLFLANIISNTGILKNFADMLQSTITDPKLLLILIMIFTSVVSGLFGAAPASSAMMPVIIYLCDTTFVAQSDWIAIAYAASICAGSSMFLWSATAGFILSKNIEEAGLIDENKNKLSWYISDYFKYGVQNYIIQIFVAIVLIYFVVL